MKTNKREQYKSFHTKEKNKIKRMERHLKLHPNNLQAIKDIERLKNIIKG